MNLEHAIACFEHPERIGERVPGPEERLALDALDKVAVGAAPPGWTRREAGWEDTDPSPVNVRGRIPPMPLDWFDRPECHTPGEEDFEDFEFTWIACKMLAGDGTRPTTRDIAKSLRSAAPSAEERSRMRTIFETCPRRLLGAMMENAGASIYEIARAMHLCGARHACAVDWINQWAAAPGNRE